MYFKIGDYEVKMANTPEERQQVRQLRYEVFCLEKGAVATEKQKKLREEYDAYDTYADYMIVLHKNKVVGTYRIITDESAKKGKGFFSETEFDISNIKTSGLKIAELSRACIAPKYRQAVTPLKLLWMGLNKYIDDNKIDILFGIVSFEGTNPMTSANAISYLHRNHLSPTGLRATVHKNKLSKIQMSTLLLKNSLNSRTAREEMPTLVKGYLNLNATFGDGVYIDEQFNTHDLFVILQTHDIPPLLKRLFSFRNKTK